MQEEESEERVEETAEERQMRRNSKITGERGLRCWSRVKRGSGVPRESGTEPCRSVQDYTYKSNGTIVGVAQYEFANTHVRQKDFCSILGRQRF